jgi:hypothetical protein
MLSNSERRTLSTRTYGLRHPGFLFLAVLFVFFETATCTVLFAQDKTRVETKPRVSLGVLIDTSAHQKKVIEFQREVVNSIAEAFGAAATESFVVGYGDEVETLQDWSPLDTGFKKVFTRIELDGETGKNQRTLLYEALNVGLQQFDRGTAPTPRFSLSSEKEITLAAASNMRRSRSGRKLPTFSVLSYSLPIIT